MNLCVMYRDLNFASFFQKKEVSGRGSINNAPAPYNAQGSGEMSVVCASGAEEETQPNAPPEM